ncbi:MAG: Rnase Y domain-containing protein [Candidatus Gracilibacteria bacterium]
MTTWLLTGVGTLIVSLFVSSIIFSKKKLFDYNEKVKDSEEILSKSKKEAETVLEDTKKRVERTKSLFEEDVLKREERAKKLKEALDFKEEVIKKKETRNNEIKLKEASLKEEAQSTQANIKRAEKESLEQLSTKTGLTPVEVKERIINQYRKELEEENEERIITLEEDLKENAVKIAKRILTNTIQRLSSPTSVESRILQITVPQDHIKGKIVGKEGRNIEELEKALDVDVIFNDLPNTISISCYNLINRRIAQMTIEKLIKVREDIDETVVKRKIKESEEDLDKELFKIGNDVVTKLSLKNLDKELVKTIGRLQFRTSYGQNIMKHSMEVAWAATMIGSELGLNVETCKIAGFLHDLGKAIDQNPDVQGTHDFLTKELMEKYNFKPEEVHAAWTHHESAPLETPEALIVKAADAISAGRPGARQESISKYLERLEALESAAESFEGVKNSFAISAGREVRVLVDPDVIKDETMLPLAGNIAKKIETELSYPGKIKVNIIRRTKHTEIAQ